MPETSAITVEEFDARHTPEGLLQRYAQGRVSSFLSRQALTLSGTVILFFLVSPQVGLAACVIALLGEAVDCLALLWISRNFGRRLTMRQATWLSTVTGAVQAMTISVCVTLAWITAPASGGSFFALAYLTGAVINAGIVLPFHRMVTLARLGVYGLCAVGLFVYDLLFHQPDPPKLLLYDLAGGVMMGYMALIFIQYTVAGFGRQLENRRELLLRSEALSRAYADLRDNQKEAKKLSLVARHAMDSVIMSDVSGHIEWVNDTFCKTTGYSLAEALGKTPGDLLNGPDTDMEVSRGIGRAIDQGLPHRAEILNYTKDGRKIWIETTIVPVVDDDDQVEMVVAIERDITQARQHAQELARAKSEAEAGARSKSSFLATMSHELRTPMNGVIGMADLLCEADLPNEYHSYAETIRGSAEALLSILNDILDLSKLEAGRVELSPVDFDPQTCLQGVVHLMQPQADARGLSLCLDDIGLPERINLDDSRLRQILLNIIGNAVKFTEEGSVEVQAAIRRHDQIDQLEIKVQDTGIGIPQDRQEAIFDSFAQADTDTTRRFGGTGLGLTISRKLADAMGGAITVQSTPGKGSCFTISLPFLPPQAKKKLSGPQDRPEVPADLTVLVAEDNKTNRLVIRKFFKGMDIHLHFAHDGKQAVALSEEIRPDIVFMDMSMPHMDGLTATEIIRATPGPQPKIVALTANGFASDRDACLNAGMDDFLTKPVRKAELLRSLSSIIPPP
ncbi:MAG: ATP-binding protein [Thalassovita sp.]